MLKIWPGWFRRVACACALCYLGISFSAAAPAPKVPAKQISSCYFDYSEQLVGLLGLPFPRVRVAYPILRGANTSSRTRSRDADQLCVGCCGIAA
jgi:hypothetical protein